MRLVSIPAGRPIACAPHNAMPCMTLLLRCLIAQSQPAAHPCVITGALMEQWAIFSTSSASISAPASRVDIVVVTAGQAVLLYMSVLPGAQPIFALCTNTDKDVA